MAHLVSITYRPVNVEQRPAGHFARVAVERATLVEGRGIEGDTKGRWKNRELNVMLAEMVERLRDEGFRTAPGELGEQLVIAGLEPALLVAGVRLRLGLSAVIEITSPRTPCGRFAHIQGKTIKDAKGRLGYMARVLCSGAIGVGAAVLIGE